jgi:integrase
MRRGELLGLRWSDIATNTLTIRRTINASRELALSRCQRTPRARTGASAARGGASRF